MLSQKCLKTISSLFGLGCKLRLLPYRWNSKKYQFVRISSRRRLYSSFLINGLSFFTRVLEIVSVGLSIKSDDDISYSTRLGHICYVSTFGCPAFCIANTLLYRNDIMIMMNSFFSMESKLRQNLRLKKPSWDVIGWSNIMSCIIIFILALLMIPAGLILPDSVKVEEILIVHHIGCGTPLGIILYTIWSAVMLIVQWYSVLFYMVVAVTVCHTWKIWMNGLCNEAAEMSNEDVEEIRKSFRGYQQMQIFQRLKHVSLCRLMIPGTLYMMTAEGTLLLYGVITTFSSLPTSMLIVYLYLIVMFLFLIHITISLANNISDLSFRFVEIHVKNVKGGNVMLKFIVRSCKASKPICVRIGEFYYVGRNTSIFFFHIILNNLCSLLLMS